MQSLAAFPQASPFAALGQHVNPPPAGTTHSLFVKGLAKAVNERQLHAIFSAFGSVADCQVARHKSGRSAGFGVVTFFRREDAQRALVVMESAMLAGRRLNVRWYSPELQQGASGLNDLAQTLKLLLDAQQAVPKAAPVPPPAPWLGTQDATTAASQLLAIQQLASAMAAARGPPMHHAPADSWASLTVTNQAMASPRMQQSIAHQGPLNDLPQTKASLEQIWGEHEQPPPLHASQLDNWARHSIDTSSPMYGLRRRSNQHASRRSLEGLELSCSGTGSAHDAHTDEHHLAAEGSGSGIVADGSRWSRPRSGSSADSASLPTELSEESSTSNVLHPTTIIKRHSTTVPTKSSHDGPQLIDVTIQEEPCDLIGCGLPTPSKSPARLAFQLPAHLDTDSLFERQPSLSSSVSSARSATTKGALKAKLSAGPQALPHAGDAAMGHVTVGLSPISPGKAVRSAGAGGVGPVDPNAAELAAALQLSGLSLGSPGGLPNATLHMEAAMRQAAQAEQMIAQLTAVRSQALMAFHAAAGMQSHVGFTLPPGGPGVTPAATATAVPTASGASLMPPPTPLEAMLASGNLSPANLDSLAQLAAMLPPTMRGPGY